MKCLDVGFNVGKDKVWQVAVGCVLIPDDDDDDYDDERRGWLDQPEIINHIGTGLSHLKKKKTKLDTLQEEKGILI